jgi:hypothetical protein
MWRGLGDCVVPTLHIIIGNLLLAYEGVTKNKGEKFRLRLKNGA